MFLENAQVFYIQRGIAYENCWSKHKKHMLYSARVPAPLSSSTATLSRRFPMPTWKKTGSLSYVPPRSSISWEESSGRLRQQTGVSLWTSQHISVRLCRRPSGVTGAFQKGNVCKHQDPPLHRIWPDNRCYKRWKNPRQRYESLFQPGGLRLPRPCHRSQRCYRGWWMIWPIKFPWTR